MSIKFLLILPIESSFKGTYKVYFGLAPPLGLLYLGKILNNDGQKVKVLDFSVESFEEQKLIDGLDSVDVVCITVMSNATRKTNEIIKIIKEKDPSIKTIVGGPHCNLFPINSLIETNADICIQGDGEKVIIDIKKALNKEKELSDISGIFYREKNEIKKGRAYIPIENLDEIPFPARHLVKHYTYGKSYDPNIKAGEFTSILTNRGCPHHCRFCSRGAVSLNNFRIRSTENILEELREIFNDGFKYVAFMDDSFLSNRRQAIDIFNAIIKENLEMKFYITASRPDSADKELYNLMKKGGVVSIQFGLESGNQDILDYYNKQTTIEKIRKAVNLSHDTGFFTTGTLVFGAPIETKEHLRNTIKFAKSLPLDGVSFLPLKYMAGAELWNNEVREGKISQKQYQVYAGSEIDQGVFTQKEISNYCLNAQREFYARPNYFIFLLKSAIKKNDYSFLRTYISIYKSIIFDYINPKKIISRRKDSIELETRTIY